MNTTDTDNTAIDNLPKDLLHPGGLVEKVMDYINETAICPQPLFALASALTLCGLLFGRRFADESNQRTNLFFMGVGGTSSGKDYALKAISNILSAAKCNDLWLSEFTSDSALEHALKRQPRLVLLIDEAGHFFSSVNDIGSGSALRSVKPSLLRIWSSGNCFWKGKQRAPQRDNDEKPVGIMSPHVCLLGMTQPQTFFTGITRSDISDGWLARPIYLISNTRPEPRIALKPKTVPPDIISMVERFGQEPPASDPIKTVPADPEATQVLINFSCHVRQIMNKSDRDRDEIAALYGKAVENARRIALTIAVGRNFDSPTISDADMTYGVSLVDYTIRQAIDIIENTMAENEHERYKKRLLVTIREAGAEGIVRKELTRKSQYLKRSERDDCLNDLIESGQITIIHSSSGAEVFKIT